MRSIRRSILYFCSALALAFSGMGFASEHQVPSHYIRTMVAEVGSYGAEAAKFKAEQAYAVSLDSVEAVLAGGLVSDGNGYLQARADKTEGQGVGNQVAFV